MSCNIPDSAASTCGTLTLGFYLQLPHEVNSFVHTHGRDLQGGMGYVPKLSGIYLEEGAEQCTTAHPKLACGFRAQEHGKECRRPCENFVDIPGTTAASCSGFLADPE